MRSVAPGGGLRGGGKLGVLLEALLLKLYYIGRSPWTYYVLQYKQYVQGIRPAIQQNVQQYVQYVQYKGTNTSRLHGLKLQ